MKEQRTQRSLIELRESTGDDPAEYAEGYGARFNELSEVLGGPRGFKERIAPGAFDAVLKEAQDTVALVNHDYNQILGRVSNGTLKLSVDEQGLRYSARLPQTSYAKDLRENLSVGNIRASSFGFLIEKDSWEKDETGGRIRTIHKVSRLFDVSPVVSPAYPTATAEIALRSMQSWEDSRNKRNKEARERKIFLITKGISK